MLRNHPALWYVIASKLLFRTPFGSNSHLVKAQLSFSVKEEAGMNQKRENQELSEDNMVAKEPFAFFKAWFEEACAAPSILEPRAMCLATSTRSGVPSARFVILRGYSSDGFRFFTNYSSRKGKELNENPLAALTFYWDSFNRSVRIEGTVEKLSEKDSTEYFHSRSKGSQIEAVYSNQSQPVSSRNALKEREKQIKEQYAECDSIPKPADWGGYILKPNAVEFWQGQNDHIHDRIRFRIQSHNDVIDNVLVHKGENGWVYERLQP